MKYKKKGETHLKINTVSYDFLENPMNQNDERDRQRDKIMKMSARQYFLEN